MSGTQRVWMSQQAYDRLQSKLTSLRELCAHQAGGESDGDSEDAGEMQRAWQVRMQRIRDLLSRAVVGEDPPDDGIAEPGMVLTVRYEDTGDTETFLLGARDAGHGDIEVYSTQSPLGAAVVGAVPGQRRTYRLPSGATVSITLLAAVPYGVHMADSGEARVAT